jgi:hypothetical protein
MVQGWHTQRINASNTPVVTAGVKISLGSRIPVASPGRAAAFGLAFAGETDVIKRLSVRLEPPPARDGAGGGRQSVLPA